MPSKVNPLLEFVINNGLDHLSVELTPEQKELVKKLRDFTKNHKVNLVSFESSKVKELASGPCVREGPWPSTTLSHFEQQWLQQWLDLAKNTNNSKNNLPKIDLIVGKQRFVDVTPVAIESFETDSNLEKPEIVKLTFDFQAQLETKPK